MCLVTFYHCCYIYFNLQGIKVSWVISSHKLNIFCPKGTLMLSKLIYGLFFSWVIICFHLFMHRDLFSVCIINIYSVYGWFWCGFERSVPLLSAALLFRSSVLCQFLTCWFLSHRSEAFFRGLTTSCLRAWPLTNALPVHPL